MKAPVMGGSLPGVPRYLVEVEPGALARHIADRRLLAIACRWNADSGRLVLGPTGVGKSLSFAQAARRLAAARDRGLRVPKVFWFRADELARGSAETIAQAKRAPVVVLDDLGWERRGRVITEVIGARYDAGRVTVATSGLTAVMFLDRYGDAILRRLVEVGGGELVDAWDLPPDQAPLEGSNG